MRPLLHAIGPAVTDVHPHRKTSPFHETHHLAHCSAAGRRGEPETLSAERRYYALLFSHEFASTFWKPGERMTFQVPTQTFTRRMADGTIGTVQRKAYTRRSTRDDAWRYHLSQMALAEEPLRYMRRYLRVEEDLTEDEPIKREENSHISPLIKRRAGGGSPISASRDGGHGSDGSAATEQR